MCDYLLGKGATVVGLDNFLTGRRRNIAHLAGNSAFTFVEQDVASPVDVGPVDYVLHMASPASPKDYLEYPIETLDVGSIGTRRMLELAQAHGTAFVLVTHDATLASRCSRQLSLVQGKLQPTD